MRLDRLQAELPPPSTPDPVGASVVQELLGGKFGEMSTFMNHTYQSFNFRNRQGARPFYELVASIAAEEFGHIEVVATAINTTLTGAGEGEPGKANSLKGVVGTRNTQHFFLETGARNNKLKVYEMVEHPAARGLTGYLLVRGGVHQVAYARALENLTGADLTKRFPSPRLPTGKIPEPRAHVPA